MKTRNDDVRVTVDTSTYVRIHGREPSGWATWIFRRELCATTSPTDRARWGTWQEYTFTGRYKLARDALQPGSYTLLT